jgi:hypothetical protein
MEEDNEDVVLVCGGEKRDYDSDGAGSAAFVLYMKQQET